MRQMSSRVALYVVSIANVIYKARKGHQQSGSEVFGCHLLCHYICQHIFLFSQILQDMCVEKICLQSSEKVLQVVRTGAVKNLADNSHMCRISLNIAFMYIMGSASIYGCPITNIYLIWHLWQLLLFLPTFSHVWSFLNEVHMLIPLDIPKAVGLNCRLGVQ